MRTSLVVLAALSGCLPGPAAMSLVADGRLGGGQEAKVEIEVPEGWSLSVRKAGRLELAGPDNFSRIVLTSAPVGANAGECPGLAARGAKDFVTALAKGRPGQPDLSSPDTEADAVDFRVRLAGSPAGVLDTVTQGRAVCRSGALAVVGCTVGVERAGELGPTCQRVVASLRIEPLSTPLPPALPGVPQGSEPPLPAEGQPRSP